MRRPGPLRNLPPLKTMLRNSFRPSLAAAVAVFLALGSAGCDRVAEMVPVVMLAKGRVTASSGETVRAGDRLLAARSLATADDSFAAVSLAPGVVLGLESMSRAAVVKSRQFSVNAFAKNVEAAIAGWRNGELA